MHLRVLTYNIRHGLGSDGVKSIERIRDVLRESRADILFLQEVNRGFGKNPLAKQADWLAKELGCAAAYADNWSLGPFLGMGNAIISRWPFHSTWNTSLPSVRERRGIIQGDIRIKGMAITLMATHWGLQAQERAQQAETCVVLANAVKTPLIFCGDLNGTSDSEEVTRLLADASLTDAWPGCPPTYAIAEPTVRIDYILTRGEFKLIERGRIETDASDHFAVLAHFDLATE